jgi:hypothetical protein
MVTEAAKEQKEQLKSNWKPNTTHKNARTSNMLQRNTTKHKTKYHIPSYNSLSVITDKMQANKKFCREAMLLYILCKILLHFF